MNIFPKGYTIKRGICAFFNGFVSAFSFGFFAPKTHNYYGHVITGDAKIDDANLIRGDWEMVGKDLQDAMDRYARTIQAEDN